MSPEFKPSCWRHRTQTCRSSTVCSGTTGPAPN